MIEVTLDPAQIIALVLFVAGIAGLGYHLGFKQGTHSRVDYMKLYLDKIKRDEIDALARVHLDREDV